MAKRFTDSEKWRDSWFRKLPTEAKLAWLWLCDNCDAAGFWEVDTELLSFELRMEVDWQKCLEAFGERVQLSRDQTVVHLTKFIEFQYANLSENCRAHRPILALVEKRLQKGNAKGFDTLSHTYSKGVPTPYGHGKGNGTGNGKDKEGGLGEGSQTEEFRLETQSQVNGRAKAPTATPMMIRIGKLFNRRATTKWSAKETKALKALIPIEESDIETLEAYYGAEINSDEDYRRKSLETLLNNWAGELDRARRWQTTQKKRQQRYEKF